MKTRATSKRIIQHVFFRVFLAHALEPSQSTGQNLPRGTISLMPEVAIATGIPRLGMWEQQKHHQHYSRACLLSS